MEVLIRIVTFISAIILFHSTIFANQQKTVLILNSYHRGFGWSDHLLSGIEQILQPQRNNLELYIEDMDSKRFNPDDSLYFKYLEVKYRDMPIDIIIACDNYALDFLQIFHANLFRNTPVVFCGINNFSQNHIAGNEHIFTGVVENHDMAATISIAKNLHPSVKHVYVIHDNTISGLANKAMVEHASKEFQNLSFTYVSNRSIEEILEETKKLDGTWFILYASFHRDRLNRYYSVQQCVGLLASMVKVPIYSINDNSLGYGIVGGNIISGKEQGSSAAQIALKILEGTSPAQIPVVHNSPNVYMFDYRQLKKFGISLHALPKNSLVINKPKAFYTVHQNVLWGVLIALSSLATFSVFMLISFIQRKKAERALRESESTLRQLAENIHEAFWLRNKNEVLYVSPVFDLIFGQPRDNFRVPEKIKDYLLESDQETIPLNFENRISEGEFRIKNASGTTRWIRYRSFPIHDSAGNVYRMADVAEDITERKEQEKELLKAQKLESIGLLAGGIAHDFNNLLSGIMGHLDLATMAAATADQETTSANIQKAQNICTMANNLTSKLLTFAKGGTPVKKCTPLQTIIRNALNLILQNGQIRADVSLPENLWPCNIDDGLMGQVFYNIILNACQAMPEGGVLSIEAHNETTLSDSENIPIVKITISDQGPGISQECLSRIFDPFFTTKKNGSGLGLSAAYSIVKRHNGSLTVESQVDQGSRFIVEIPAITQEPVSMNVQQKPACDSKKKRSILFLDDEPYIARIGETILKSLGYDVVATTTSQQAIELFRTRMNIGQPFDIAVLDLTIKGGMGGKDVLQLLQTEKPSICAIASSGYYDDPVMAYPQKYGFKSTLRKPYTKKELQCAVEAVIREIDR